VSSSPPSTFFHLRHSTKCTTDMAPVKNVGRPRGTIIGSLQSGLLTFVIRAIPLPESITSFLLANTTTIKRLHRLGASASSSSTIEDDQDDSNTNSSTSSGTGINKSLVAKPEEFWIKLEEICKTEGKEWKNVAEEVWAFGPKKIGANLLIDRTMNRS
jgi:ribosome assembly protein 1